MKFDVSLHIVDHGRYISERLGVTALLMLFIISCAKISSPSGGPRDLDPPVIIKSMPENSTTMFRGKSFTITFNEYVVLDNITEKFMVSPPMATKPEVGLKGKSLIVKWEDDLADSTTYTFYFQDAIRDNNESNPINNYQYVLSTGPFVDSLSLTGNVFGAFDLEAVSDITVMMYSNLSDTAPRKIFPAYISKPDQSGGFLISNIKPGRYKLYALGDLNGNKLYDLDNETFAFCDSIINIAPDDYYSVIPDTLKYNPSASGKTSKPTNFTFGLHRLYAFLPEPKKQYLTFADRKSAGSLSFGLALPSDSGQLSVSLVDAPTESWFMENNTARDTFMLWITDPAVSDRDLIQACLDYPFTDSTGTLTIKSDTVKLRYHKQPPPRGGRPKTEALKIVTNINNRIKPGTILSFLSETPLEETDTSLIAFSQTIDTINTKLGYSIERDSSTSRHVIVNTSLSPGVSYTMICKAGAFKDIYGKINDSTAYRFSMATEEDYGSVKTVLSGYEGDIIVQLLDDKENLIREVSLTSPGEAYFPLLDKGTYRLKVIYDLNSDGKWTTGDYDAGRSPEPVSYYPAKLEVKINWALEQDWDISAENSKDISLRTILKKKK